MRRVLNFVGRGVFVAVAASVLTVNVAAREPGERGKDRPIVKVAKKVIRSLGDLLTVPRP